MKQKHLVLLTTFLEGITVMMVEIAGARIMSPVFGTSLHTWSLVLGVTLLGLAVGYFTGGYIAKQEFRRVKLHHILAVLGLILLLMPSLSEWVLHMALGMNFYTGLIFSLSVILFPPLWLLGTLSPILVHKMDEEIHVTGMSSGSIFALSTAGGIIGAILFGLYLLPSIGIVKSLLGAGTIMLALAVINGLVKKPHLAVLLTLYVGSVAFTVNHSQNYNQKGILYKSDSVLGQVKVMQLRMYNGDQPLDLRMQLVNNTLQAMIDVNQPYVPYLQYQTLLAPMIQSEVKEGEVLMLGLGGGLLYNAFARNSSVHFDIVELDQQVIESAKEFFLFPKQDNLKIYRDDARHYIQTCDKKYNMIIIDTFSGESVPGHVITDESLARMRQLLTDEGILVINFHGYWEGEKGRGARSVLKTLNANDYSTYVVATNEENSIRRSLLFVSSKQEISHLQDLEVPKTSQINEKEMTTLKHYFLPASDEMLQDGEILTDNKQQLEHMLNDVCLEWRKYCIDQYVSQFSKENQAMFW